MNCSCIVPLGPAGRRAHTVISVTAIALLLLGLGCGKTIVGSGDDTALEIVKDGHFTSDESQTKIRDLASCYFGGAKFKSLKAKDDNVYVNLSGKIRYAGKSVDALLQFRVNKPARTFEVNAFELNGIPQNTLLIAGLISDMISECSN